MISDVIGDAISDVMSDQLLSQDNLSSPCDTVALELGELPSNHGNNNAPGNHGNNIQPSNHGNNILPSNLDNAPGNHDGNNSDAQLAHIEAEGTQLIESTKVNSSTYILYYLESR